MGNGCESGAGCLCAASDPSEFRDSGHTVSLARPAFERANPFLCAQWRLCGCHAAVESVSSVGAVTQSVPCTRMMHMQRFKLESSALQIQVWEFCPLTCFVVKSWRPCMPCRSYASFFFLLVLFGMHFFSSYRSGHAPPMMHLMFTKYFH